MIVGVGGPSCFEGDFDFDDWEDLYWSGLIQSAMLSARESSLPRKRAKLKQHMNKVL